MFYKLIQLSKSKFLAAFVLTFLIGLTVNAVSGNYRFCFNIAETFTKAEAESKLNKRITAKCSGDSKAVQGTVISYHSNRFDSQFVIEVEWDEPLLGRYGQSGMGKEFYEHCVTEINSGS